MSRPLGPDVTVAGLTLHLGEASAPLTRRLMDALRTAVRAGHLRADTVLPPSRQLASELGCSRWVVTEAYGQLVAEGYLSSTQGSGTRVRDLGDPTTPGPPVVAPTPGRAPLDLAPGVPDLNAFPRSRWAESCRRAVLSRPTDALADTSLHASLPARVIITDYLRRTRQVSEEPTQLSLSTGSRSAVGWVARLLRAGGHRSVAVEDPSWPGLRDAARQHGLQPVPIPVDDDGLRVDQLDASSVRAVITTPTHQFPTGVVMSTARRLALIDWARRVSGLIIEDDYDAEFRYDQRPVASLQGMAPDRVALLGSVSKTLASAVGLGWVVLPQWLIERILAADLDRGVGPAPFTVDAFATMIDSGWYEQHLRSVRTGYRRRREAVLDAVAELLPGCSCSGLPAGAHFVLHLPPGVSAEDVAQRARRLGVAVTPIDRYQVTASAPPALVLGFGNLRSGRERTAIERLAVAIR